VDGCRGDACGVWLCAPDTHDSEPRAHLARVRLACELAEAASGTPASPFMVKRGSCVARYALAEGLEDDSAARAAAAEARAAGPDRVLAPPPEGAHTAPAASQAPAEGLAGAQQASAEPSRAEDPQGWCWWRATVGIDGTVRPLLLQPRPPDAHA